MIIVKKPEEKFYEEGYGFFLGDIGKFIFKAVPAAVGGFLVGNVPGAVVAGISSGFIGGKPSKVLKRFLYGVGVGGTVAGVTGLIAPEYQAYVQGPLSSKISEALSKIKTSIPGMTGGEIQTTTMGAKEAIGQQLWESLEQQIQACVLPPEATGAAGVGTAGIGAKLISASKELIKTSLETLAKGMVVSQIPSIIGAQMQYPTAPFQIYQLPEEEGGGSVVYEPTTDTLIIPQPVAEKAVEDVKQEIQAKKGVPTKPEVPAKPKAPIEAGIQLPVSKAIEKKYLPYIILFTAMAIGVILAKERR